MATTLAPPSAFQDNVTIHYRTLSTAEFGLQWEENLAHFLRRHGRTCLKQKQKSPYDLLVDGWRVEVKASEFHPRAHDPRWIFNVQRHGKVDEHCDFYVLCLTGIPYCSRKSVYLLLRAPLEVFTFSIYMRTLLTTYASAGLDFLRFARGECGRGPLFENDHALAEVCNAR